MIYKKLVVFFMLLSCSIYAAQQQGVGNAAKGAAQAQNPLQLPNLSDALMNHIIMQSPEKFQLLVKRFSNKQYSGSKSGNYILVGKPGVGKTTLAQAFALKTGRMYQIIHGPDIGTKFINSGPGKLKEIFQQLHNYGQPVVLIVDEITSFTKTYDDAESHENHDKKTAEMFWSLLDGCQNSPHISVIATTNYLDKIPAQIVSRFRGVIELDAPSYRARLQTVYHHLGGNHGCSLLTAWRLAWCTKNMSNRDLAQCMQEAKDYAADDNGPVCFKHIQKALAEKNIWIALPWCLLPRIDMTKEHKETLKKVFQVMLQIAPFVLQILSMYQSYVQAKKAHQTQKKQHQQGLVLQQIAQTQQMSCHQEQLASQKVLHEQNLAYQKTSAQAQMEFQKTLHEQNIAYQQATTQVQAELQRKLHEQGLSAQETLHNQTMSFQKTQAVEQNIMQQENLKIAQDGKKVQNYSALIACIQAGATVGALGGPIGAGIGVVAGGVIGGAIDSYESYWKMWVACKAFWKGTK